MSINSIKAHSWDRHREAAVVVRDAATRLDSELRAIARRADLHPAGRQQLEAEARQKAAATVAAGRQQLLEAIGRDREMARWVDKPEGAELALRSYWATAAGQELAGLTPADAHALVESVVKSGDQVRAREYIRAARGALTGTHAAELAAMAAAVRPEEERAARSMNAAVDAMEVQVGWLDTFTSDLLKEAGRMSDAQRDGLEADEPMSGRIIDLWVNDYAGAAVHAFNASADQQAADAAGRVDTGGSAAAASGELGA